MSVRTSITAAARCDRGRERASSQDVVIFGGWASGADGARQTLPASPIDTARSFAVVDGMGGHSGGELAAWLTAHALVAGLPDVTDAAMSDALAQRAHALVSDAGAGLGHPAMGAAFAAVVLDAAGYAVLNIGDCRVYRVLADRVDLLSVDDAAPSRHDPDRLVLTQSIGGGVAQRLDTHFYAMSWETGAIERFVVCSDGLVGDTDAAIRQPSADGCADALIATALAAGAPDNVSVVVIDVTVTEAE